MCDFASRRTTIHEVPVVQDKPVTWEAIGALAALGQFVVVMAAAVFAVAQLRLMRRQSELQATIPYFAYTRTSEFNVAFAIVRNEIAEGRNDVELRAAIAQARLDDSRVLSIYNLASVFNELGVLVQERMIDEELVVSYFRWQIVWTWELFAPYITFRRAAGAEAMMVNFEALAVRARAYDDRRRLARARRLLPPGLRAELDRSFASTSAVGAEARAR